LEKIFINSATCLVGDTCDEDIYVRKEGRKEGRKGETMNCSYDSNTCNCKMFDKNGT